MLAAGVVAIGLLLGSRGEAPRLEKFEGVLLTQAVPSLNESSMESELQELVRSRPSALSGRMMLGWGLGLSALGGAMIGVGALGGGFGGGFLIVFGLGLCVASGFAVLIGTVMLIVVAVRRAEVDERIRLLESELPAPAQPQPLSPSVMLVPSSGALLARF